MCLAVITDEDVISRLVFGPHHIAVYPSKLSILNLFEFKKESVPPKSESVNCHRLLDIGIQDLHRMGDKKAYNDNLVPRKVPRSYEGYIEACVSDIRNKAVSQSVKFDVKHSPKIDNKAHCDLLMIVDKGVNLGKAQATAAKENLFECFSNIFKP